MTRWALRHSFSSRCSILIETKGTLMGLFIRWSITGKKHLLPMKPSQDIPYVPMSNLKVLLPTNPDTSLVRIPRNPNYSRNTHWQNIVVSRNPGLNALFIAGCFTKAVLLEACLLTGHWFRYTGRFSKQFTKCEKIFFGVSIVKPLEP